MNTTSEIDIKLLGNNAIASFNNETGRIVDVWFKIAPSVPLSLSEVTLNALQAKYTEDIAEAMAENERDGQDCDDQIRAMSDSGRYI